MFSAGRWARSPQEPWFRQRPVMTLAVAGLLYVSVLLLRLFSGGPVDGYSLLYVFPVALIAIAFGVRAGLAAGLLAVGLMAVWVVLNDVHLGLAGWVSRVLTVMLLGLLVGDASDRLRKSELEKQRLEARALLYREAIEINDSLVQGMAAARWALEAGRLEPGLHTLEETIGQAQELVSDLIRRADMGTHATSGIGSPAAK